MDQHSALPLWLKLSFTGWILFWAPAFAAMLGVQNYFWLCNVASFLILLGLWLESRLLLSMQWLSVTLVGALWSLDVGVAWLTGVHPIGGTEYMLDPEHPWLARVLSLYHLILPLVAGYAVLKLGYDPRALRWQTLLTWLLLPLTYLFSEPERNINWVHGPFGTPQHWADPRLYLLLLALVWPLVLYLPLHVVMGWWQTRRNAN
ncbi:hypothetical protein [Billgrantia ethanolica]|uniref:Membrane-associated protein n=1 Tax=Billgrantia ethanolica TaxID=2733486 RepID=A0ABS9A0R7_9GAMM|nr:hypothetical protein [Halomonas ethanolica]MCE8002404.1 hypothetical protein [Halomonas ethanolica]